MKPRPEACPNPGDQIEHVYLRSRGGLQGEPRELEEQQEMVTGEAGRGQVVYGLDSHTNNSGFYLKGKGSE